MSQADFKSIREIFEWLLKGGKIQYFSETLETWKVFELQDDGNLSSGCHFKRPSDWKKVIEPVYEYKVAYTTGASIKVSIEYYTSFEEFKNQSGINFKDATLILETKRERKV